ncbi:MAG: hypothetical protein WBH16_03610 [Candidatus Nanopelagicales bacterium]
MFEDAKKEYDQAIDRNNTLGELANQKVLSTKTNPHTVLSKVIVVGIIAIGIALLVIL